MLVTSPQNFSMSLQLKLTEYFDKQLSDRIYFNNALDALLAAVLP